jgi:cation transport ATPase
MIVLQIMLVLFSYLLLAAHFLRAGAILMMLLSFGLLALLFVRQPWAARVLQGWLLFGAVVWILTAIMTAVERAGRGRPALRMLLIMGAVAAVTVLAAWTLQRGRLRHYFNLPPSDATESSPSA